MIVNKNRIKIFVLFLSLYVQITSIGQGTDAVRIEFEELCEPTLGIALESGLLFNNQPYIKIINNTTDTLKIYRKLTMQNHTHLVYKKNKKGIYEPYPNDSWHSYVLSLVNGDIPTYVAEGRYFAKDTSELKKIYYPITPLDTFYFGRLFWHFGYPKLKGEYKIKYILKTNNPKFLTANFYFKIISNKKDSVALENYYKKTHYEYFKKYNIKDSLQEIDKKLEIIKECKKMASKQNQFVLDFFDHHENELFQLAINSKFLVLNKRNNLLCNINKITKDSNAITDFKMYLFYNPNYNLSNLFINELRDIKITKSDKLKYLKDVYRIYFKSDPKFKAEFKRNLYEVKTRIYLSFPQKSELLEIISEK